MPKKKLFLFTADFPFGNGETFLETEIKHLAGGFDEIHIISLNTESKQTRPLPDNVKVSRFDLDLSSTKKTISAFGILSRLFWQEIKIIRRVYNLSLSAGILKTMLISLSRANLIEKKVSQLIESSSNSDELYFYSYWCDDVAIGLAMSQNKHREIKTFCRIHRWDVYFEESSISYLPFRHFISKKISRIYSISQDGIDYASRVWKIESQNKFELSRLGIDNERQFKNLDHPNLLIVSCSNIIGVKRVHLIAEALKDIHDWKINWVHIGDGPERFKIESIIAELPENIEAELIGRIPNVEIYEYYNIRRPDLFINVSSSEGVPVSIMEAMSFGIPVIATEVGGNAEIVNNENGFLLKADPTISEIADSIQKYYSLSPAVQSVMQKNSFETWQNKYNASTNYSFFLDNILAL